jgi:hypothetical protein
MWAGIFAVVVGFSFALSLAAIVMQPQPDDKQLKLRS